jgi:hypothetical protein
VANALVCKTSIRGFNSRPVLQNLPLQQNQHNYAQRRKCTTGFFFKKNPTPEHSTGCTYADSALENPEGPLSHCGRRPFWLLHLHIGKRANRLLYLAIALVYPETH